MAFKKDKDQSDKNVQQDTAMLDDKDLKKMITRKRKLQLMLQKTRYTWLLQMDSQKNQLQRSKQ